MKKIALILGSGWTYENDDVLILKRTHLYEGHGIDAVVAPIREAARQGIKTIILTNAAGSISHEPGTICLISDHINLTAETPVKGAKFVDMTDLYIQRLRSLVQAIQPLPEAIYAQFKGAQYETPAEVRMACSFGADLMGMSTALEAIAAREEGMEIIGLSLVTNWAAGISPTPLSHEEVLAIGQEAKPRLNELLTKIIQAL
jgi:purine-nucleoside phosphorylase